MKQSIVHTCDSTCAIKHGHQVEISRFGRNVTSQAQKHPRPEIETRNGRLRKLEDKACTADIQAWEMTTLPLSLTYRSIGDDRSIEAVVYASRLP